MTNKNYDDLAEQLRMVGNVTRLKIFDLLSQGPVSIGELGEKLRLQQSYISRVATDLRRLGFVTVTTEGVSRYLSLSDDPVVVAVMGLLKGLEKQ